MITRIPWGLCALAGVFSAHAGNYSLSPATTGASGSQGTSIHYSAILSVAPGQTGGSANYFTRTGFPALIPDFVTQISAPSSTVNEGATLQFTAAEQYADGTEARLSSVAWSTDGPASITASGLLTAAAVYQNTAATAAVTGAVFPFTVINTLPDNFGLYAGDRLPDSWQVQYFGLASLNGGQQADFDSDSVDNLLEFAFGTNPASGASGLGALQYAGTFAGNGSLLSTGMYITGLEPVISGVDKRVLFVRRTDFAAAGLRYTPQFSNDLTTWYDGSTVPVVLADDGTHQIVSVSYHNFIQGRKVRFFRLAVTFIP